LVEADFGEQGMTTNDSGTSETQQRRFYDEQISLLKQGRVSELIESHYHEDAVLVSATKVVSGTEALKEHFHAYMKMLGNLEVLSVDAFAEANDSLLFEATVRSALGEAKVYDAFVFRDGVASHHFTGLR
jgi:hypothetical protein